MNKYLVVFLSIIALGCKTKEATKKPNVVFIFADDLTYSAINALGNKEIETPNLNSLVAQGTTFTNAYNMGAWNGAVCAASRAMMISGRSVWNVNNFRQKWASGNEIDKTWGKLMEQSGYETYMTGKWHVDAPGDKVFNHTKHIRPGMPSDAWNHTEMQKKIKEAKENNIPLSTLMPVGYNRPLSEKDSTWSPSNPEFGGFWQGGKHWSEVLKDDALGFLEQAKNSDKPFFMYLAFNAPHDPRQAPQEYIDKYPLENITIPESWLPEYPYKDAIWSGQNVRDEALAPFPRTHYATKKHIQEYYALITHLDDQIGKILERLEESGQKDNTYIIFTADHGLAMGRHGLLGKQNLFDHSIRAPFMIVGPGIAKGKKNTADIYIQDAMATSLDIAGVSKPAYIEFNSVLGLAKGETTKSLYESIYGGYRHTQRMIRKEGFKLLIYPEIDKVLLFDLKNDPEEMNDISDANKDKVTKMFDDLIKLQAKMNDTLDLSKTYQKIKSI